MGWDAAARDTIANVAERTIRLVRRERVADADVLGLAEFRDGTGLQLLFQYDPHDREGWPALCITNEAAQVHYGGLEKWAIKDGFLMLGFSAEAAEALGIEPETALTLDIPSDEADALSEALSEFTAASDK